MNSTTEPMNPIADLEALAQKMAGGEPDSGKLRHDGCNAIEAIIEALKKRDEAVRKVAEEIGDSGDSVLQAWAERLREALDGE